MPSLSNKAKSILSSPTLEITAKAKALKKAGRPIVSFGAGEPDFDTPESIKQAAVKAINDGFTKYTAATGIVELKEAIVTKLKRDNNLSYQLNQIVVGNGAKHVLANTLMAILNPGDEVLVFAPYWLSYPEMIKMADGQPVIVPTDLANGFNISTEQLATYVTPATKAIILNSPCNPTGVVYQPAVLEALATFAIEHDLFVISDEIYEKLIYGQAVHQSIAGLQGMAKRTIVINGVSKAYAMTGWRIGYAAGPTDVMAVVANLQSHQTSNPNAIAQKAALAALTGDNKDFIKMHHAFDERRRYMIKRLSEIPDLCFVEPEGAFYVYVNISAYLGRNYNGRLITTVGEFAESLLEMTDTAVIPGDSFGLQGYVRFSYAMSLEEIKEGLDRLEIFMGRWREENATISESIN